MTEPSRLPKIEGIANARATSPELLQLRLKTFANAFSAQSFSFWMASAYFLFEYTRPQSILPLIDFLPWMQVFLILALISMPLDSRVARISDRYVVFWLFVFLVVMVASGAVGYAPSISFSNLDKYYLWLVIILVISKSAGTEARFFILLVILLLASFKLSLFGARTWVLRGFSFTAWGIAGPEGFFKNSGELSVQMVIFFAISIAFYEVVKDKIGRTLRFLILLMPITAAMTVLGASSRGAQIALGVQVYLIFFRKRIGIRPLLLAIGILAIGYLLLPDEQVARFTAIGDDKSSQQRLLYWKNGWDMMLDHPYLGVGFYNFIPYFERFYPNDVLYAAGQLAHNIFIQVGADLGFIGLAVYVVLIYFGFALPRQVRRLLRESGRPLDWRNTIAGGFEVGFIGFLVAGQFVSIVYYPFMWIHLALMLALLASVNNSSWKTEYASHRHFSSTQSCD